MEAKPRPIQYPAYALAFLLAGFFPLYLNNGFFDVVRAKFTWFLVHACVALAATLVVGLVGALRAKRWPRLKRPEKKTLPVLVFLALCCLSALLSPYGAEALFGQAGRRAGLLLWLACGVAYLLVLACGGGLPIRGWLYALLSAMCLVSLFAVANLLGADPLRVFSLAPETLIRDFLSTIGNVNFLGAYLCLCLPAAVYGAVHANRRGPRLFYAFACATGFAGLVATGSDAAFVGMAVAVLLLCCHQGFALSHVVRLLWLGCGFFCVAAAVGAAYAAGPPKEHLLRGVAGVLARPMALVPATVCALGALAARWLLSRRGEKPLWRAGRVLAVVVAAGLLLGFLAANLLGVSLGPQLDKLFLLRDEWGSNRGYLWKKLLRDFAKNQTLLQQLLGTGPDTVAHLIEPNNPALLLLNGSAFDSAHNEYIHLLVGTGLAGLVGWLWVLAGHLKGLLRWPSQQQCALGLCVATYAVQAFFNIAMPTTLPLLWLLLALLRLAARGEESLRLPRGFFPVVAVVEVALLGLTLFFL